MQGHPESRSRRTLLIIGLLAGLVAFWAAMWVAGQAVEWATLRVLDALDMLSAYSYDAGTMLAAEPALWVVAALYTAPAALVVTYGSASRLLDTPTGSRGRQRVADVVLMSVALVVTIGVVLLALDPSRGNHESITDRVPELTSGPAHLVVAATWTMLAVLLVTLPTGRLSRRRRMAVAIAAFVLLTPAFGSLFG